MADFIPWILIARGLVTLIAIVLLWRDNYVSSD